MKKINRLLEKSINLEDYEKIYGQLPTSLSKSAVLAQQLEEEEAQESEYESSEEDPSQDVITNNKHGIAANSTTIGQKQPENLPVIPVHVINIDIIFSRRKFEILSHCL